MIVVRGLITNGHMMDAYMRTASECQGPSKVGFGFRSILLLPSGDCLLFSAMRKET